MVLAVAGFSRSTKGVATKKQGHSCERGVGETEAAPGGWSTGS